MTRYREIGEELARRVLAGDLVPGDELPGIRELGRQWSTAASTASRAQRALAEAGLIELADRRRARVAADALFAARRFLHGHVVLRLAGSDDPALDLVVRGVGRSVVPVPAEGSAAGLRAVAQGRADAAATHLLHHSGQYNAPFARALLRGRRPHLVHLWRREQGLLIPSDRPGPTTIRELAGRRVARRVPGTGTRVLLDRLLLDAGLDPDNLRGPEVGSHLEVALAVATGIVDAGLGVRSAAAALDLRFVPITWEDYDLVLAGDALDPATPLITALRSSSVRAAVEALGGYDTGKAGEVVNLE
ncbi:MAG TPA: helix-turn-helix transcriptional regulator [Pseudonocardia sp.]|nr:helix-turn-helix transcriptional regulator [Pseudonocardia sp.]